MEFGGRGARTHSAASPSRPRGVWVRHAIARGLVWTLYYMKIDVDSPAVLCTIRIILYYVLIRIMYYPSLPVTLGDFGDPYDL